MSPIGVERNKIDEIELTITIQKDASGYGMKVGRPLAQWAGAFFFYDFLYFYDFFPLTFRWTGTVRNRI